MNGVVDQTDTDGSYGTFTKTNMNPQITNWDINCTDEWGNTGTTTKKQISDTDTDGPFYLQNCEDLNAIRNYLDANYTILNDINCYETKNWNNGAGFEPIGNYVDQDNKLVLQECLMEEIIKLTIYISTNHKTKLELDYLVAQKTAT